MIAKKNIYIIFLVNIWKLPERLVSLEYKPLFFIFLFFYGQLFGQSCPLSLCRRVCRKGGIVKTTYC